MSGFSLKPYEALIPGVQYREGRLRLRPTWAATTLDLYVIAFGVLIAAVGLGTHSLVAIGGIACIATGTPYLRCRVVAEERTIRVVNKWRGVTLDVNDIKAVKVQEFEPSSFVPFRAPGTLWPRTLAECTLVRHDGSAVRCDALVGLPSSSDTEGSSPIEEKAAILRKWVDCGAPTDPTP